MARARFRARATCGLCPTKGERTTVSNDTYVVVNNGKASKPMDWGDALGRAKYLGEVKGQTVELHRVRNGKTAEVMATWDKFRQTKG